LLRNAQVAIYATGVRAGGAVNGKLVGVLGINAHVTLFASYAIAAEP
jgi:hypothetical protein